MMRLRRTQGTRNVVFFFNDTATTEIYTLSLHDALPISYLGVVGALTAHSEVESDGDEATRLGLTAYPLHRDIKRFEFDALPLEDDDYVGRRAGGAGEE